MGSDAPFEHLHGRRSISIHAPRMGSDPPTGCDSRYTQTISIHAPRMGSDRGQRRHRPHRPDFNPRSPDGERPRAPRCSTRTSRYFNPRSPDGERRLRHRNTMVTEKFQSTLPGWGATRGESNPVQSCRISIHAPRMGSDASVCRRWFDSWHFNPRSPDGERRRQPRRQPRPLGISIHAPRMGSDADAFGPPIAVHGISIHAPRMGSDHARMMIREGGRRFQSTLPGWGATRPNG